MAVSVEGRSCGERRRMFAGSTTPGLKCHAMPATAFASVNALPGRANTYCVSKEFCHRKDWRTIVALTVLLLLQCGLSCAQGLGPGPGSPNAIASSTSTSTSNNNNTPSKKSSSPTSSTPSSFSNSVTSFANSASSSSSARSRSVDTRVQFEVEEERPRRTVVGQIPIKAGFTYRFNEVPEEFELNATSGVITTAVVLDRETLPVTRFDLVILSSQPTYPIEVRITVLDINDNTPVFPEANIRVSFSESATPGTRVILDTATDRDVGANAVTTDYRIVSGNEDNKFRLIVITNPSGETPYLNLEIASPLDRENRALYQLNVSARDGGKEPLMGFVLVNITVLDVNDNPPIFDHSDYVVSLNESVAPGTNVLQVRATDTDEGENSRMTYFFNEMEIRFEVDPDTGVIRTQEKLNCRQSCPGGRNCPKSCVFTVFAHDNGSPRQDGRTYVTVNLMDANDHDPVIRFRYFPATGSFATVDENAHNGSVVAAVSVIDPDDGVNGETTLRIKSGNEKAHFHLEHTPSFDIVRVNGVLDREKTEKYNLTIVATDKGSPSRSSTAFLIIHVNDVNDHAPMFQRTNYSSILSELVPVGSYVASVTATDEDTGINSRVYYAIVSGNERQWFDVDSTSGLVTTVRPLDRESQSVVELKLSARDGGPSPRWTYTFLKISILDENDEAPKFEKDSLSVSVPENSPIHTPLLTVKATDGDRGINGTVVYYIDQRTERDYPEVFSLNGSTGLLTTNLRLDREVRDRYVIHVVAKDRGAVPLSSVATIVLLVTDINDSDPVFYPLQYFATVEENASPGTSVVQVKASDPDEGANAYLKFSIVDGSDGAFEIDADRGIVRTTAKLGKYAKPQYRLTVLAKDVGDRESRENAVVDIVVESNQVGSLEFSQRTDYVFRIVEDASNTITITEALLASREVGRVSASTQSSSVGENGSGGGTPAVEYSIIGGDEAHLFVIDHKSGAIATAAAKAIDRESQSKYSLTVLAQSGIHHGTATVNITVDDVNDNPPRFHGGVQTSVSLAEDWPVGHEVYAAHVEDHDKGANGRVTFRLEANADEVFTIDDKSGMVYLQKVVDFEAKSKYQIEIVATDGGSPALSSKQLLTILVDDVNDHTPQFEHLSVETSLYEGTAVNDRFFALTASDKDSAHNGLVSYSIVVGSNSKFGMFPDGHLYVKSSLDRESQNYYELVVVGRDHGVIARSSSVTVVIHVLDENDNEPKFANKTFKFNLPENEPPDTYIGQLLASDADVGRNAELTYSIRSHHQQPEGFIIDPKTGIIKSTQYFDHEKLLQSSGQSVITLEAFVMDNGVVRLQDEAKVVIRVSDVNDNAPRFVRLPYKTTLSESAPANSPVLRVSATDADEGASGHIVYSLTEGNVESKFSIDSESGQITLVRALDRETVGEYTLLVMAKDAGLPISLNVTAPVFIQVLDENDNAPEIVTRQRQMSIHENATVGTRLLAFEVVERDLGVNSEVSFSIPSGNVQETFRIDSLTGILYLNKALDHESRSSYLLNISATDGGSPHLSSSVPFTLTVLDVNDNAPTFSNVAIVRQVQEGIPVSTPVVTVLALDPDDGLNGKVRYSIVHVEPPVAEGLFAIRPETGVIYTTREVDREQSDTFRLTVMAVDGALPESARLSAEKLVTVIVEDVNDNAPHFVCISSAVLPANAEEGATVALLSATDADANENGKVSYELIGGDPNGLFALERHSGRLYLNGRRQGPAAAIHTLLIKASDGAVTAQRKTAELQFTVIALTGSLREETGVGERGGEAAFSSFAKSEYGASIPENETAGLPVLTVQAVTPSGAKEALKANVHYYVTGITSRGVPRPRLFDIDRRSGLLSTAAVLDRESGFVDYVITVVGVDRSTNELGAFSTKVKVSLIDKNDSPPAFQNVSRSYSVSEDAPPGYTVAHLTAIDPDANATVTYRLLDDASPTASASAPPDGLFALDADTGVLTLRGALDRETRATYRLTVEASDGQHHALATISLNVADSNDNAPVFSRPAYSFDIPEDAARGARVGAVRATDADDGENAQLGYAVVSDWGNDVFSLNPQTGVFTLTSHLDYEQTQHYIFVVQAQDSGASGRLSSTVSVYINVLDLNDNAPLFDPMSYSDEVPENVTVGTSIIRVSATDQDSGANGEIVYSLAKDSSPLFSISSNGTVYTTQPLDREQQSSYQLMVTASDRGQPRQLSSTIQVTVIVRDVNDNAPEFVTPNTTSVPENTAPNTVLMTVRALDRDEGRNSHVEYSLQVLPSPDEPAATRGGQPPLFTIGPVDGMLRVNGRLDRELSERHVLRVTARDRGRPPMSSSAQLIVRVLDENDNAPVFAPAHYSAAVAENASAGSSVLQVSATDRDNEGEGGGRRPRYSIVAGDANRDFAVSEDSGIVRVVNELDYETRSLYVLTVQASDEGGGGSGSGEARYDTATVTVSVTDCNDNPPVFVDSPYRVHVMEEAFGASSPSSAGGRRLTSVSAWDRDTAPNAQLRYFLKDGDHGLFNINGTSGDISVHKALDRELTDRYELVVIAMDSGTPRLTGTGTVQVLVDDVNDNSPRFLRSEYVASVAENLLPNTSILTVSATDSDDGQNAVIRYSLTGEGSDRFKINHITGEVLARESLDREERSEYRLTAVATDQGLTITLNGTASLHLLVGDDNDNAPKFEKEFYVVHLPDPTAAAQFVFGATALDPDDGPNGLLTYELGGADADKFTIEKETGVVLSVIRLHGAINGSLRFTVRAFDAGKPTSLSSTVSVDVRLQPPARFPTFFDDPTTSVTAFTLSETARGEVVTTVCARRSGSGTNGTVRYAMAGGNAGDAFSVDPVSGQVVASGELDYERVSHYRLWIEARSDSEGSAPSVRSVTAINVTLTDANDNAPVFGSLTYNSSVAEEELPPLTVMVVTATDADSGANGQISYRLRDDVESTASGVLSIDARTGRIFTNAKLDREALALYSMSVEAVDAGSPPRTGTATVFVHVKDKNDNPPRFTRLFSANVTENAEPGTFVIQVTSSDRDAGENANASYSFTENPGGRFRIDPVTGNVTVAGRIDRETRDEYILKVSALDGSWRAETPLTITVQDVNDNAPAFERAAYEFDLPELRGGAGSRVAFVGRVMATDRDKQGPNAYVSYAFKQSSDLFDIDPSSGEIYSKHQLRYRHTRHGPSPENGHRLSVVARDHGKPPLLGECAVLVNVVDANDHPPVFASHNYFSPVAEGAAVGLSVVQVLAADEEDYGANAKVEYTAQGGNGSHFLAIDKDSGWVTVSAPVSGHEESKVLVLHVRARDKGIPPQQVETTVQVVVTGENRFSPAFSTPLQQIIVPENETPNSVITTLSASDADTGLNGQLLYGITGGNEKGKFAIDPQTGRVSILEALDYESDREFRLNVTARDRGFHWRSALVHLAVVVTDVNDNAPVFEAAVFHAYVAENSAPGVSVFRLSATDADSARHALVQYSAVGGSGKEAFSVDPSSGVITALLSFDTEEKDGYVLEVLASNPDMAQYSSARVLVHVTGVNEFYPRFVQSVFQFTVSESSPVGTAVGSVTATDRDAGADGDVFYLLVGSSGNRGFVVNAQTGVVYVSRRLDRESLSRVVLTVVAKNAGPIRGGNDTDEAQVVIQIQDGNDPPVFSEALYEVRLPEDSSVGSKVSAVRATDRDTRPANSHFTYSIIAGNREGAFKIDPLSGEIRTAAPLDRETVPVYNLTVAAIDSGVPPQTATTVTRIYVDDVNDNGPVLDPPAQAGSVAEDEAADTVVVKLTVSDPDLPPNGAPFLFAIVGGEHSQMFTVDQTKGLVRTRRPLDRELARELHVIVEVSDAGNPPQKSRFPLAITVRDKNDNPSSSRNLTIIAHLLSGAANGALLADVHPLDPDADNDFRCNIVSASSSEVPFSIQDGCRLYVGARNGLHAPITSGAFVLQLSSNDGVHPEVDVLAHVEIRALYNRTVENCVTVRIPNITTAEFVGTHLRTFTLAVEQLLVPLEATALVLSAVQEGADVEVFLAGTRGPQDADSDFLAGRELARVLSGGGLGRTLGRSLTVDHDPCDDSPCRHRGQCASRIVLTPANSSVASSPHLVLTSTAIRKEVLCTCQLGFTGRRCEHRANPCSPSPCHHGGTCSLPRESGGDSGFTCLCPVRYSGVTCEEERVDVCAAGPCENGGSCQHTTDGNYFCMCRPGFRGGLCELVSDGCRPNPCENGGSCSGGGQPGFRCSCRAGYYGAHCERATHAFHPLSHAAFPALASDTNDVAIVFSTTKPDGLLLYDFGPQVGGRSDFVALEILSGRPRFSFGGARTAITALFLNVTVTDGKWFKVTVTRNGRVASMMVSSCWDNGATCQECTTGNSECFTEAQGNVGTLNFNSSPMFLGGIPHIRAITERPGQVRTDDFVGCVQSVYVDGRALDLASPLSARGTSTTCPRFQSVCRNNDACADGGSCVDQWFGHTCLCPDDVTANDCNEVNQAYTLEDGAYLEFRIGEKHRRRQLLDSNRYDASGRGARGVTDERRHSLSLQFRTSSEDSVLLYLATNEDYTALYIKQGRLHYTSKLGTQVPVNVSISETAASDNLWHNVSLMQVGGRVHVSLDGVSDPRQLEANAVHPFLDPYLTKAMLGSSDVDILESNQLLPTFEGCISRLIVDGQLQPLNGTDGSAFESSLAHGILKRGCASPITLVRGAATTDPLNIGVTLVIVFFVVLIVAILVSFVVFRRRRQQRDKASQATHAHAHTKANGNGVLGSNGPLSNNSDSPRSHQDSGYVENGSDALEDTALRNHFGQELAAKKYKEREVAERPQRPDIIEREVLPNKPLPPPVAMLSHHHHHHHQHQLRLSHQHQMGGDNGGSHLSSLSVPADSEGFPEHYDLENASSIAPSDIDIVYHYKGYRDGSNLRKYKTNPQVLNYHKQNAQRISPHLFPASGLLSNRQSPNAVAQQQQLQQRESPSVLKMQSTPLARLSPSSELSSQQPRILTLQDISGRPLQSALLATSQRRGVGGGAVTGVKGFGGKEVANSERSGLNSPVSHLSHSTGSAHSHSQGGGGGNGNNNNNNNSVTKRKMNGASGMSRVGLTAEEIERLNTRPRNSSLVSTLDVVSSSSSDEESRRHVHHHHHMHHTNGHLSHHHHHHPEPDLHRRKLSELLETNTELLEAADDSSTDESGNDSFTCSEFEYENTYDKPGREFRTGNMIFSKLAEVDNENDEDSAAKVYDGFESFRGSLSTLVASDDDVSNMSYKPPPNGGAGGGVGSAFRWDCLLNWGPSFESMVGVFKDIAELPDTNVNSKSTAKPGEEYV